MLIYHGFITDVWCFITWTHEKIELKIKTRVPIWPAFVVTCGHVLSHLCGFTEKIAVEPNTSKRTSQFVSHFWFHTHIWIHSKKTYQWITTIEILPQSWKWRVTLLYSKLLTRGDQFSASMKLGERVQLIHCPSYFMWLGWIILRVIAVMVSILIYHLIWITQIIFLHEWPILRTNK